MLSKSIPFKSQRACFAIKTAFLHCTPLIASNRFISPSSSDLRNEAAISPHRRPSRPAPVSVPVSVPVLATVSSPSLSPAIPSIENEPLRSADVPLSAKPRPQSSVKESETIEKVSPTRINLPPRDYDKRLSPGLCEDSQFPISKGVRFWRNYVPPRHPTLYDNLGAHFRFITQSITQNASSIPYWFFTMPRITYFSNMALLVLAGSARGPKVLRVSSDVATRFVQGLDEMLFTVQADFENVRDGVYRLPWDMRLRHRQYNPFYVLRQTALYVKEGYSIISRYAEGSPDVSVWMESSLLPEYYKQSYHLQTDGWLSSQSAEVYELSTESLFFGRQDAMQRSTLIPISEYIAKHKTNGSNLNFVEIAAGTGRFATFVRDNWPQAHYTITDLSPFYLEKARENMKYWESKCANRVTKLGQVRFMQAAAEDLPIEAGSADIVYSVFLFHELPPEVRRKVLKEVHRVLKVGGLFVLTDSIQKGDQLSVDKYLGSFSSLNEPWYESYIEENFVDLLCARGRFRPMKKEVRSKTKMLSFIKCK